jgi:hypothetical protein
MTFDRLLIQKDDLSRNQLWDRRKRNASYRRNLQDVKTLLRRNQILYSSDHWSLQLANLSDHQNSVSTRSSLMREIVQSESTNRIQIRKEESCRRLLETLRLRRCKISLASSRWDHTVESRDYWEESRDQSSILNDYREKESEISFIIQSWFSRWNARDILIDRR